MGWGRRDEGYHGVGGIAVLLKDLRTLVILIPLSHLYPPQLTPPHVGAGASLPPAVGFRARQG